MPWNVTLRGASCQWLVATYTFRGVQSNRARLPFPATGAYDDRRRLISGVPAELKRAQAELALDHATNPLDKVSSALVSALQKVKTGPVELTFGDWLPSEPIRLLVERELSGLVESGGRSDATVELGVGHLRWAV